MSILRILGLRAGTRRHEWLIIWSFGIAAGVLGVIGYAQSTGTLDTIYDTIKLYSFGYADVDNAPWELQVARFLAPASIVFAGAKALVALFQARLEDGRIRRSRDHVLICGLGRRGLQLVETFGARGDRIVAVELDPSEAAVAAARDRGAMVVVGDATDETVLRHARADRARCVIAVCAADRANLEIASIVDRMAGRDGRAHTTVVQVSDDELARALSARAVDLEPGRPALEVVNVFERGARALLRRHPLLADGADPAVAEPPHLLVVGLGRMGGALLVGAARLWEALGARSGPDRRLRITVVDPDGSDELARLRLRHPRLDHACDIAAVGAAVGTPEFEQARFLNDGPATVDAVYVCLEDEEVGLRAGLTLLRRLEGREVPVVVQVTSSTGSAARLLSSGDGALALPGGLAVFGLIEETSTPELLLDNTTETIARALHEEYLRGHLAGGGTGPRRANARPWEELDEPVREDNRAQARHVGSKLDAIGCGLRPL
ncbi:MAG: hypothetical protein QOK40_3551, partial [Miltoncostaeaceae bacterium]|nr:hypothetical protein [Miltoncostaeaceae bacterium]